MLRSTGSRAARHNLNLEDLRLAWLIKQAVHQLRRALSHVDEHERPRKSVGAAPQYPGILAVAFRQHTLILRDGRDVVLGLARLDLQALLLDFLGEVPSASPLLSPLSTAAARGARGSEQTCNEHRELFFKSQRRPEQSTREM